MDNVCLCPPGPAAPRVRNSRAVNSHQSCKTEDNPCVQAFRKGRNRTRTNKLQLTAVSTTRNFENRNESPGSQQFNQCISQNTNVLESSTSLRDWVHPGGKTKASRGTNSVTNLHSSGYVCVSLGAYQSTLRFPK